MRGGPVTEIRVTVEGLDANGKVVDSDVILGDVDEDLIGDVEAALDAMTGESGDDLDDDDD